MSWWRARRPEERMPDPTFRREPEREADPRMDDRMLTLQRTLGGQSIQQARPSYGEPLSEPERQQLEGAFGVDLDDVRIHRGPEAEEMTQDAAANAFTSGRDIYFAPGAYSAATLAHEISHAVQQAGATGFSAEEDSGLEH